MGLPPVAIIGALLAVLFVGQAAVLTVRLADDEAGGGEAIHPGPEMVVSDALLTKGHVSRATVMRDRYSPPSHTLYGEAGLRGRNAMAGLTDPLDGRLLAVGSAFDDSVPMVPTAETPGFRAIDLDGRQAAVGRDRVWTWVTWNLPDCFDECQGYTVGRNLSEEEVLTAARGATADRANPDLAASALPAGMAQLVRGAFDLDGFNMRSSQVVARASGDGGVSLKVAPGEALAPLLRFFVEGRPTSIRGQTGSAGSVANVGYARGSSDARAWAEGGRTLLVLSSRLSSGQVDRFVRGLRPARGDEWEQVRSRVLDISSGALTKDCYTRGEPIVAVGSRKGTYRWAVGFSATERNTFSYCDIVLTPDNQSRGGGGNRRPDPGRLSALTIGLGGARDPIGLFVIGVAPPRTARVQATKADGRIVDAEVADKGPSTDERWYAVFIEGDIRVKPAIVAFDDSGAELDRIPGGGPT